MATNNPYLGTGWSFPPAFDTETKSVEMLTGEADIKSSLEILLGTRLGERVMQPRYGCNLDELVFEPATLTFKTYIKDLVTTAIVFFESRIELIDVRINDTQQTEGVFLIEVDYKIRATNSRFNFVYPFYKEEGSNIS